MRQIKLIFHVLLTMFLMNNLVFAQDPFTITTDGNVGIGTAVDPTQKLVVEGFLRVVGTNRLMLGGPFSAEYLYNPNGQSIRIHVGGDDRISISNAGNVGIGTTSPGEKLAISLGGSSGNIASFSALNSPRLLFSVDGVDSDLSAQSGNNLKLGTAFSGTSLTVLNSNGNVGIGIDSPQSQMHIVGNQLRLSAKSDINKYIQLRTDGTNLDLDTNGGNLYLNSGGTLAMGLGLTNVGIGTDAPTQKLDVVGNARFRAIGSGSSAGALHYDSDGNLTTDTSDERLKNNIEPIENSLDMISRISGRYYTWKDKPDQGRMIGLIAQEVEDIVPELVFTNPVDGFKGVHYEKAVALLIEGMKEQQLKIDELSQEIFKLKNLLKTRSEHKVSED